MSSSKLVQTKVTANNHKTKTTDVVPRYEQYLTSSVVKFA